MIGRSGELVDYNRKGALELGKFLLNDSVVGCRRHTKIADFGPFRRRKQQEGLLTVSARSPRPVVRSAGRHSPSRIIKVYTRRPWAPYTHTQGPIYADEKKSYCVLSSDDYLYISTKRLLGTSLDRGNRNRAQAASSFFIANETSY